MRSRTLSTTLAAAACAVGLALSGAGVAGAQEDQGFGSLNGAGSSNPVFDSPSKAVLAPTGAGAYKVAYENKSGKDLACVGFVLPADVAAMYYEYMKISAADGNATPTPAEEEAINAATEAGHVGIVVGDGGLTMEQVLRAQLEAQMGEEVDDATVQEYIDMMMSESGYGAMFTMLDEALEGKTIVNFVDNGKTATWEAKLATPLASGKKAGGVLGCFDGISKDAKLTEATYLEVEHAEQGTLPGGALGSGSLGSLTGSLGS